MFSIIVFLTVLYFFSLMVDLIVCVSYGFIKSRVKLTYNQRVELSAFVIFFIVFSLVSQIDLIAHYFMLLLFDPACLLGQGVQLFNCCFDNVFNNLASILQYWNSIGVVVEDFDFMVPSPYEAFSN